MVRLHAASATRVGLARTAIAPWPICLNAAAQTAALGRPGRVHCQRRRRRLAVTYSCRCFHPYRGEACEQNMCPNRRSGRGSATRTGAAALRAGRACATPLCSGERLLWTGTCVLDEDAADHHGRPLRVRRPLYGRLLLRRVPR